MIDFLEQQEAIKTFIETEFAKILDTEQAMPKIKNDVIDLEKYNYSNTLFINFDDYTFEELTLETETQSFKMEASFICRNAKNTTLKKNYMNYATKFKSFVHDNSSFGGLIDFARITNMHLFEAATGTENIKAAVFSVSLKTEI